MTYDPDNVRPCLRVTGLRRLINVPTSFYGENLLETLLGVLLATTLEYTSYFNLASLQIVLLRCNIYLLIKIYLYLYINKSIF